MVIKTSPVYELHAEEFNIKLAKALKQFEEFKAPEWSYFVKTGVAKIKPPTGEDFWFRRAASILRQAYVRGIVGVNRLKTRYGSKQNRGMKPEIFRRASGKIIRNILQQAEAAGLLEKYNVPGKRAGRKLTAKGKEFLESIGGDKEVIKKAPEVKEEKQEVPVEKTEAPKSDNSQNDSSEEQEKSEQSDINKKETEEKPIKDTEKISSEEIKEEIKEDSNKEATITKEDKEGVE